MNTKKYEELLVLLRSHKTDKEILEVLSDYHENDIADMLAGMNEKERKRLYRLLGTQRTAEIFAYLDEPQAYFDELSVEQAARVVSLMDSDDAVDLLENLEDEDKKEIVEHLDEEAEKDVRMLLSYDDDEIGSYMTTNYICIPGGLTVKQAMSQLVRQAGENDNIMTIYVVDSDECFAGAIDLKDLITAREGMNLESIIAHSYPYVLDHEKIDDCIDTIKDYAEDSIPVLSKDKHILGVITSDDIVEMVDNEMGEDYAKLAGLTAEEDLKETTLQSMKKRMPWLIILLFLGMIVSSVVGIFENVVAALPIVICFQSLVLDMAGNVGTQSLAVTIRVLMDENLSGKQKLLLVVKEVRIGLVNGGLLGIMALVFLGIYVHLFKGYTWLGAFAVSGCVGVSLLVAMAISSLVGTVIPMFFHKIKIDPAVASGPLISQECYDNLVAELRHMEQVELPQVRDAIAEARDKGDLSENFEYHAAKREQGRLLGRISYKQKVLENARVIDKTRLKSDVVGILSKVKITNLNNNRSMSYTIVSASEANVAECKISVKSPIAQALLNKKVEDVVDVRVPAGTIKLRIDSIEL